MKGYDFSYNGISAKSIGVKLVEPVTVSEAKQRVDEIKIPGKNGLVFVTSGDFENRDANANCLVFAKPAITVFSEITRNYFTFSGYRNLELYDDPEHFYAAKLLAYPQIAQTKARAAEFMLDWSCKPQRFLKSGRQVQDFTLNGNFITNPTPFTALPIVRVYGNDFCAISIGSAYLELYGVSEYVDIDCELQEVYRESTSMNHIMLGKFPTLPPGDTAVVIGTGVTKISITPRWWEL